LVLVAQEGRRKQLIILQVMLELLAAILLLALT
jgi:hypothetical protein